MDVFDRRVDLGIRTIVWNREKRGQSPLTLREFRNMSRSAFLRCDGIGVGIAETMQKIQSSWSDAELQQFWKFPDYDASQVSTPAWVGEG